jgi:hypothetical protein
VDFIIEVVLAALLPGVAQWTSGGATGAVLHVGTWTGTEHILPPLHRDKQLAVVRQLPDVRREGCQRSRHRPSQLGIAHRSPGRWLGAQRSREHQPGARRSCPRRDRSPRSLALRQLTAVGADAVPASACHPVGGRAHASRCSRGELRASMALTVFASAFASTRLPTIPTTRPSRRPLRLLPSRTTTTSTSVVPLGRRVRV